MKAFRLSESVLKTVRCVRISMDSKDADTPVMVYLKQDGDEYSATFDCANDTGEVEISISDEQCDFLRKHEDECNAFYDSYRVIR